MSRKIVQIAFDDAGYLYALDNDGLVWTCRNISTTPKAFYEDQDPSHFKWYLVPLPPLPTAAS
jgi:hypothetical protein